MKRGENYKLGSTFGLIPMHLHPDASINKVLITGNEKINMEYFKDQVVAQHLAFGGGLLVYGYAGIKNMGARLEALFKASKREGSMERFKQSEAAQAAPQIYELMCAQSVIFIEPDSEDVTQHDAQLVSFAKALYACMSKQETLDEPTPMMQLNPQPFMTFLPVNHDFLQQEWISRFLKAFRAFDHSIWLDLIAGAKPGDEKLLQHAANLVDTCIMFRQPLSTEVYFPQYRPRDLNPLMATAFYIKTEEIMVKVRMLSIKEWDIEEPENEPEKALENEAHAEPNKDAE